MDDELREHLRVASAPTEVEESDRLRMRTAVAAEHHRRSVRAAVGGSVAAVLSVAAAATAVGAIGPWGQPEPSGPADSASPPTTTDWQPIADSPYGGRANAVGVWTGTELLVAGGEDGTICPPAADCLQSGTASAEATAYDPEADSWRLLPPAPEAFDSGLGIWLGDQALFVATDSTTLLLDPETDIWTRGPNVPGQATGGGLISAGDDAIRFSYSSRGDSAVDHRFDTASGAWEPLPRDPFGESYDRSMAWLDGRLWLLSMAVENHFGADQGKPSRLAVLDGDQWRVVDDETPDMTQLQWLVPQGDLLVVAENRDTAARNWAYDPATDEWRELVPSDARGGGCYLGNASRSPSWITAGNRLVSGLPPDALQVPPCPDHAAYQLVAWAGDRLILWGGVPTETSSEATNDGVVWVPRQPE